MKYTVYKSKLDKKLYVKDLDKEDLLVYSERMIDERLADEVFIKYNVKKYLIFKKAKFMIKSKLTGEIKP